MLSAVRCRRRIQRSLSARDFTAFLCVRKVERSQVCRYSLSRLPECQDGGFFDVILAWKEAHL